MSTIPPILIPIVADDQTVGALNTAQSRVQSFRKTVEDGGVGMEVSMIRARGGIALAAEEIDLKLNRHLRSAMLELFPGLASAAQAAFPIIAGVAFIGLAERIPGIIAEATDKFYGLGEQSKETYKGAIDQNKQLIELATKRRDLETELGEIGAGAAAKQRSALERLKSDADELHASLMKAIAASAALESVAFSGENKGFSIGAAVGAAIGVGSGVGSMLGGLLGGMADDKTLRAVADKNRDSIVTLYNQWITKIDETKNKTAELGAESAKAADAVAAKLAAAYDQVGKKANAALGIGEDKFGKQMGEIKAAIAEIDTFEDEHPGIIFGSLNAYKSQLQSKLDALQVQLKGVLPGVFNEADQKQIGALFSDYKPAIPTLAGSLPFVREMSKMQQALNLFHSEAERTFGSMNLFFATNGSMAQAWGRAVEGMLQQVAMKLLWTYLISQLLNGLFFKLSGGINLQPGPGAFGGASLPGLSAPGAIGTLPGRAYGGDVAAGSAYFVGERGPELFVPRQSGSIVPNGAIPNVQVNVINQSSQPVDARAGRPRFDGRQFVIGVVLEDLEQGGSLGQALKSRR